MYQNGRTLDVLRSVSGPGFATQQPLIHTLHPWTRPDRASVLERLPTQRGPLVRRSQAPGRTAQIDLLKHDSSSPRTRLEWISMARAGKTTPRRPTHKTRVVLSRRTLECILRCFTPDASCVASVAAVFVQRRSAC